MEQAGASAGVPVEGRKQSPTDLAFQVGSTRKRASDLPTTLSSSYNSQAFTCSEGAHSSEIGCCHHRALAALTPWWRSMASHPRAPRRISTLRRWPACSSRARLSSSSIEVRTRGMSSSPCLPGIHYGCMTLACLSQRSPKHAVRTYGMQHHRELHWTSDSEHVWHRAVTGQGLAAVAQPLVGSLFKRIGERATLHLVVLSPLTWADGRGSQPGRAAAP